MKSVFARMTALAVLCVLSSATVASASTIAEWTFNNYTAPAGVWVSGTNSAYPNAVNNPAPTTDNTSGSTSTASCILTVVKVLDRLTGPMFSRPAALLPTPRTTCGASAARRTSRAVETTSPTDGTRPLRSILRARNSASTPPAIAILARHSVGFRRLRVRPI